MNLTQRPTGPHNCFGQIPGLAPGKLLACLCLALFLQAGCSPQTANSTQEYRAPAADGITPVSVQPLPAPTATEIPYASVWKPLAEKLARDGLYGPEVNALLAELGAVPTQSPMGRKISELYRRKFMPSPKTSRPRQLYYKGVVTQANAQICRQYINEHRQAFINAQNKYGVPPATAAALLFVETRLGKVLADVPENAFFTLASMAVSTRPEDISDWLPKLKDYQNHLPWLDETLQKRSAWAYNETRALIQHMLRDNIPPSRLPSSIYGAVGLCQFMPSNISPYGADGDGDGRVDLFNVPDAIASLANYLAKHGWKAGISRERQHKLLMSYNHSVMYANTIMALADLINGAPRKRSPAATGKKA